MSDGLGGRYLHGHHDSVLSSHRWRTVENSAAYFAAVVEADFRILDVGCGPGTITAGLAALVPEGAVIGIDRSAEVIAEAKIAAPTADFVVADLMALGIGSRSVDAVHLHQVLQHLVDPVGALGEVARVLVPGGVLAARDSDYSAMSWSPADPRLDTWLELYRAAARSLGAEPDAGPQLEGWARAAGFEDVEVSVTNWVYETPEERRWWGSLWADRMTKSALASTILEASLATPDDLAELARAWREFSTALVGRFEVPCTEILARR